jgi:peptide chain release factor 3
VFFGSALTNFGLEPFLQALVDLAPPPQPHGERCRIIAPTTSFHRLCVQSSGERDPASSGPGRAVRVCSAATSRRTWHLNSRLGKSLKASRVRFLARSRNDHWPTRATSSARQPGTFAIGDTPPGARVLPDLHAFPQSNRVRIATTDTRYKQFDEDVGSWRKKG